MEHLALSTNKRYLTQGRKPFFWLGDTAWLLFCKLSEEDAYIYLKNRADKGYNFIQAVLVYAVVVCHAKYKKLTSKIQKISRRK